MFKVDGANYNIHTSIYSHIHAYIHVAYFINVYHIHMYTYIHTYIPYIQTLLAIIDYPLKVSTWKSS